MVWAVRCATRPASRRRRRIRCPRPTGGSASRRTRTVPAPLSLGGSRRYRSHVPVLVGSARGRRGEESLVRRPPGHAARSSDFGASSGGVVSGVSEHPESPGEPRWRWYLLEAIGARPERETPFVASSSVLFRRNFIGSAPQGMCLRRVTVWPLTMWRSHHTPNRQQ